MSCINCDCHDCSREREAAEEKQLYDNIVESWSWNLHPIECAQDAIKKGLPIKSLLEAMESRGFNKKDIDSVEVAYEVLQ